MWPYSLIDWGMVLDWINLAVRWTHVVAGIAWIGSSFYFIALDAGLKPHPRLDKRVSGEAWQVHGGGFYQIQKYTVAPEFLPPHLTWFKWEAYSTWIFGFILLVLVYYANPGLYLIDSSVANITPWDAVPLAAFSLVAGWLAYDALCRSWIGRETGRLALTGFVLLVLIAFGYTHVFSGRGAFIQVGALIGSIMVANVLFIIIPNQRKTIDALLAGREPDPTWGYQAKQRSIHNNYLTLPVVFTMLSNHYSFTYETKWNWLVLACIFVASFLIRHWFNTMHTGAAPDWRLWPAAAVPVFGAMLLTLFGQSTPVAPPAGAAALPATFAEVQQIVQQRCHVCHSARPSYPGFSQAPKGVMFDTPAQIATLSQQIYAQAVKTHAMPLNNITRITEAERGALGAWITAGSQAN
jgi:uncharacterized membrane protein